MQGMFYVRSARALAPHSLESGPPRACRLHRRHPTPSRLPGRTSSRTLHARLSTRQGASVFNQPLSFDTSKVTNMGNMFYVRSARALAPTALSRASPCTPTASPPHPTPSHPALYIPSFFDSAGELGQARVVGAGKLRLAQLSKLKPSSRCA